MYYTDGYPMEDVEMEWVVRGMSVTEAASADNETVKTPAATGSSANTSSESVSGATSDSDSPANVADTNSDSAAISREALRDYLAAPKLLDPCPFVTNDTTDLPQFTVAGCRAIETIAETSTGEIQSG